MRPVSDTAVKSRMAFLFQHEDPIEKMRARADQIRRLARITDDPAIALDLRCCAAGLEKDLEALTTTSPPPQLSNSRRG